MTLKKIKDIGKKAMENDDSSLKSFKKGFNEVFAQMKELRHNDFDEEFEIIDDFVFNHVMRATRMSTLTVEEDKKSANANKV